MLYILSWSIWMALKYEILAPPNSKCFYDVDLWTGGFSVSLWVKFMLERLGLKWSLMGVASAVKPEEYRYFKLLATGCSKQMFMTIMQSTEPGLFWRRFSLATQCIYMKCFDRYSAIPQWMPSRDRAPSATTFHNWPDNRIQNCWEPLRKSEWRGQHCRRPQRQYRAWVPYEYGFHRQQMVFI